MSIVPTPPRGIRGVIPPLPATSVPARTDAGMPNTGDVLDGRYLLQEPLGQGGVGVVFRALQFRVKRTVAVKFLHDGSLGAETQVPRFEREALALAALSHPNIVRLQDYGVIRGVPYLVMELAAGRTLGEVIEQEGALPVPRALVLVRQLLHALAYAHELGIVHRDMKAANVIVQSFPSQPEHVKVLDFGFAKFLPGGTIESPDPLTRPGFAFGSPAYISPEQCTIGAAVDGRADLYSVGVLLFEMLTGRRPYEGETPELLRQHLASPVPRLRDKNPALADQPALQALVERALAKLPDQRFANAAEFLLAIDALESAGRSPSEQQRASEALAVVRAKALLSSGAGQVRAASISALRATRVGLAHVARISAQTWTTRVLPWAIRAAATGLERAVELVERARARRGK